MPFDPRAIEAKLSLSLVHPEDIPPLACDALEAGYDSAAIRRMASFLSPTGWETDKVLPAFMADTGMNLLSVRSAFMRIAYDLAREILDCRKDPLQFAAEFRKVWIKADYPSELDQLGQLPDHIYLAQTCGNKTEAEVRQEVHDLLLLYVRDFEKRTQHTLTFITVSTRQLSLTAMPKLSIRDLDLANKRVLIRVDFNVPLADGLITDDTRIRETIPTIEYALRQKAKVILAAHLGRPKGKPVESMSLRPIVVRLRELLDHVLGPDENVGFSPDCVGEVAEELANNLEAGQTLLLENLRFHPEEEKNDPAFAEQLADLCDLYVNDAFGAAHRAHASTEGIARVISKRGGQAAAGLLMQKELDYLGRAVTEPARPFVAIIGGAKVSDKIEVINSLLEKVDALLIGGAMAYTFLNAKGQTTGKSLVEADKIDVAKAALDKAAQRNIKFLLPVDHVLADKFAADATTEVFSGNGPFPGDKMALDIGPETVKLFSNEIANAATVIWNGPMGVAELAPFAHGTNAIAKALANNPNAITIVGGGDSVAAIQNSGFADRVSHISTGGGASLEFLEGKALPGVEAFSDK